MNKQRKIKNLLQIIKDVILNYECFAYIYIFTSVIWFFPLLGPFMDYVFKVVFVWGIIILLYDFFIGKTMFKGQCFIACFLFLLSYVITILVNIQGQFYMGIKHLIYSAIAILIIFNLTKNRDKIEIKNFICKFNSILIAIAGIASAISLLMYFFSVSIEREYMGNNIRQGFIDHRLFGVYTSANTGATMAIFSVVFMLINNYIKNNRLLKWSKWYKVNFLIQLVYYSLTLSRGGQVTIYAAVALFAIVVLLPKYLQTETKKKSVIRIVCIFFSFCFIGAFVPKGIQRVSMFLNDCVSDMVSILQGEDGNGDDEELDEEDNEIKRIESGDDMSNNRFTIWTAGIELWKKAPFFGVADARIDEAELKNGIYDISDMAEEHITWLSKVDGNLHNSYVEILVNCGLVGSVMFLVVAVLIGIKYIKFLLNQQIQKGSTYYQIGIIFMFVVSILVNCCFENRILFDRQNPFGLIFWLYLGIGCSLIDCSIKKVKCIQDDETENSICV